MKAATKAEQSGKVRAMQLRRGQEVPSGHMLVRLEQLVVNTPKPSGELAPAAAKILFYCFSSSPPCPNLVAPPAPSRYDSGTTVLLRINSMKIIISTLALVLVLSSPAFASPRYTAAKRQAEKVKQDEKELSRRVKKLTAAERERLKTSVRGTDSDSDGVSDVVEGGLGSSRCNTDSDNDGLDDSQDPDEDNGDSDGDGFGDATEVSAKGKITAYVDPNVTVKEKTFRLTDSTVFKGLTKADLKSGLCVEIEGHTSGAENIADKVKDEDC